MSIPPPPPGDPFQQRPGPAGPPPPPTPAGPPSAYPAQHQFVQYQYVQVGRTSGLAIASMVLGIVWIYWVGSILAVIFGHIAISQMRKDETLRGRGMAIAGVVLGYVGLGILVLAIIVAATASSV
jgi:Domain of unknown function (DUF4190)